MREKAMQLRSRGYSYNLIADKTGISKSTLYGWLAQIPYTPNAEVEKRIGRGRAKASETKHMQKLARFKIAQKNAQSDIKRLTKRVRFMFGLALYLGEGEKNENVGIINSDPDVIVFMIGWLKEHYGVGVDNLTLAIHIYPDNNTVACMQFWSGITGIPKEQFGKTQINRRKNKRLGKRSKLPYGTAHLRVRSGGRKKFGVLLSRRIKLATDMVLKRSI